MNRNLIKVIAVTFVFLTLALVWVKPAQAEGIVYGDTVPAGDVVEQNLVLSGKTVTIDGKVEGDVLAMGEEVILNGEINGSMVAIGKIVTINGVVTGNLYVSAVKMTLDEGADIQKDLTFVGLDMLTVPNSVIGRDLQTITPGATLDGQVGRKTRGVIGVFPLLQSIWKIIKQLNPELSLPILEGSRIVPSQISWSTLRPVQLEMFQVKSASSSIFLSMAAIPSDALFSIIQQPAAVDWQGVGQWSLSKLRELVLLLVLGGLALWIYPKIFERSAEIIWRKPLQSTGWGLLVIIFVYSALGLLALLLIPVMLFFGLLTLNGLAGVLGIIGYTSIILASTLVTLVAVFVTKTMAGTIVWKRFFERFLPKAAHYRLLLLFLGSLLYVLISAIPYLGWLVSIWLSMLGMGAIWLAWRELKEEKKAAQEPMVQRAAQLDGVLSSEDNPPISPVEVSEAQTPPVFPPEAGEVDIPE